MSLSALRVSAHRTSHLKSTMENNTGTSKVGAISKAQKVQSC